MKVIFLDIDGTLIDYDLTVPESAREAINETIKKGNKVYLCTGCSKGEVEHRQLGVNVNGMIGANGGYIESDGKVIMHKCFKLEDIIHFVDWCNKREMPFNLECNDGIYINKEHMDKRRVAMYQYVHGKGSYPKEDDEVFSDPCWRFGELYRSDVNKVDFVLNSYQDHLDSISEFPDYFASTWGGKGEDAIFGDLSIKGVSKATSIEILLKQLNIDRCDAYGFGDAKVDIPMFEVCGTSVAMANGSEECKKAATYVTDTVKNDGLYKAFKHFGLID